MAFEQSGITSVSQHPGQRQVFITWTADLPAGTWYQVYRNGGLLRSTQAPRMYLPIPAPGEVDRVDVGYVASTWGGDPWGDYAWASTLGMEGVDYSDQLPAAPQRRARLTWQGGAFQGADIAGFRVYGSDAPGGPVDYTTPLATITAYPAGIDTSGWGHGAWGSGAWGSFAGAYSWTSGTLASGVWSWAIVPFDAAGNPGTAATTTTTIAAPPAAPPTFPGTPTRLKCTLAGWGPIAWGAPWGSPWGGLPWGSPWGEPAAVLTWNPTSG